MAAHNAVLRDTSRASEPLRDFVEHHGGHEHTDTRRQQDRPRPVVTTGDGRREWTIVVITSSSAGLLTAQDFGAGVDADRRFSYVVTPDRDLALDAGRSLLSRLPERPGRTLVS